MTRGPMIFRLVMYAFLASSITTTVAQPTATRPLTGGIESNQQYLQRYTAMLKENEKEQKLALGDLLADEASILAGKGANLAATEESVKLKNAFDWIAHAADAYGAGRDGWDTTTELFGHDWALKMSDSLKAIVDVVGSVRGCAFCEALGKSSTATDIFLKSTQLSFLQQEHKQLENVVTQLKRAQELLLAKDPAARARINAAARQALRDAEGRQRVQSDLLRQYYKDKPRTIQLSVKNAFDTGLARAFHVANGVTIVDPNQDLWRLADMPQINPDFISALRCSIEGMNSLLSGGSGMVTPACPRCRPGDPCDRYPDGSYINAFLSPARNPNIGLAPANTITNGGITCAFSNTSSPEQKFLNDTSQGQIQIHWSGKVQAGWQIRTPSNELVNYGGMIGPGLDPLAHSGDLQPGVYRVSVGIVNKQPAYFTMTASKNKGSNSA